ncbi:hypothetical protein Y09_2396 [Brachybacterium sp. SW0106-09]|nr:hypothetical protein Y09_2396 [Brachybacterium sp. SW0106-09]
MLFLSMSAVGGRPHWPRCHPWEHRQGNASAGSGGHGPWQGEDCGGTLIPSGSRPGAASTMGR